MAEYLYLSAPRFCYDALPQDLEAFKRSYFQPHMRSHGSGVIPERSSVLTSGRAVKEQKFNIPDCCSQN